MVDEPAPVPLAFCGIIGLSFVSQLYCDSITFITTKAPTTVLCPFSADVCTLINSKCSAAFMYVDCHRER